MYLIYRSARSLGNSWNQKSSVTTGIFPQATFQIEESYLSSLVMKCRIRKLKSEKEWGFAFQENFNYDYNKLIDVNVLSTPFPYLRQNIEFQLLHVYFFFSLLLFQIKAVYVAEGFPNASVTTQCITCGCNYSLTVTLELWFNSGIPTGKTIEGVFQAALEGGNITSLTENNTVYKFSSKCRKLIGINLILLLLVDLRSLILG